MSVVRVSGLVRVVALPGREVGEQPGVGDVFGEVDLWFVPDGAGDPAEGVGTRQGGSGYRVEG